MRIRVATRNSPLARAQTDLVIERLRALRPELEPIIVPITTRGDADLVTSIDQLGERGVFTRAVQAALLDGRADLAVHSYKDMPTDPVGGLVIVAVPERADPRDALVAGSCRSLHDLPPRAIVGTSSARRAAQVRAVRDDLETVPLRGNVGSRVARVERGEIAAAILARAGLERAGLAAAISATLEPPEFLPAPAQGALAVEAPEARGDLRDVAAQIDDSIARAAVTAERAFLHGLRGGCSLPAAALARVEGARLTLDAGIFGPGSPPLVRLSGAADAAAELGRRAAEQILAAAPQLIA